MRILITNDDGINAPGLAVLQKIAQDVAGETGEVWTVAPAFEQSGVGHCISYAHPSLLSQMGPRRFAAEGSPADCVLAGVYHVMPQRPDLVLSGVNRGNNAAENTLYSGTIGGAMEAALQDIPAIALSQYFGPDNAKLDDPFEASVAHGAALVRDLWTHGGWDDAPYRLFYNVNFPPTPADGVQGRRVVRQGKRPTTRFSIEAQTSPTGRDFMWIKGGPQHEPTGPDTDAQACLDGFIAVTPMRADLTDHALLTALEDKLG